MDLELDDKIAVVTGASKGIGLAVVRQLIAEGATVVAGARTIGSLEGIERVTPVAVDLSDPRGPGRLVDRAIELHGRVDILVNNVGAAHVRLGGFLGTSDADFESSMTLNSLLPYEPPVPRSSTCSREATASWSISAR